MGWSKLRGKEVEEKEDKEDGGGHTKNLYSDPGARLPDFGDW
jgi:hypothetical protein